MIYKVSRLEFQFVGSESAGCWLASRRVSLIVAPGEAPDTESESNKASWASSSSHISTVDQEYGDRKY